MSSKLPKWRDNMEEKTPLSRGVVCFQMLDFGTSKSRGLKIKLVDYYFFLKNFVTSDMIMMGATSQSSHYTLSTALKNGDSIACS